MPSLDIDLHGDGAFAELRAAHGDPIAIDK
jgi:hypothetical protein